MTQRVGLGIGTAMDGNALHDRRQCIGSRQIAVHHRERLAVVSADTDLDPGDSFIDNNASNFETAEFAPDLAVLDRDLDARIAQHADQLASHGGRLDQDRNVGGFGGNKGPTDRLPHHWRLGESRGPAGHEASHCRVVGDDVQRFEILAE